MTANYEYLIIRYILYVAVGGFDVGGVGRA